MPLAVGERLKGKSMAGKGRLRLSVKRPRGKPPLILCFTEVEDTAHDKSSCYPRECTYFSIHPTRIDHHMSSAPGIKLGTVLT